MKRKVARLERRAGKRLSGGVSLHQVGGHESSRDSAIYSDTAVEASRHSEEGDISSVLCETSELQSS